MKKMYKASVNSVLTYVTQEVNIGDTEIHVADISILPSPPNLVSLGRNELTETIRYNGVDTENNVLLDCERGFQGVALLHKVNTELSRNFTAYDHDTFIDNINELEEEIQEPIVATKVLYDDTTTNLGAENIQQAVVGLNAQVKATESSLSTTMSSGFTTVNTKVDAVGTKVDTANNNINAIKTLITNQGSPSDLIYEQTLMQSVSDDSVDWVFRRSTTLGTVLCNAFGISSTALSGCTTIAQILANTTAFTALCGNAEAMDRVADSVSTMTLIISSTSAYNIVVASTNAMKAIANSVVGMTVIIGSTATLTKAIQNSGFMTQMANSENAMSMLVVSQTARNLMFDNASVTESILGASSVAFSVMSNSDRVATYSGSLGSVGATFSSIKGFALEGWDNVSSAGTTYYRNVTTFVLSPTTLTTAFSGGAVNPINRFLTLTKINGTYTANSYQGYLKMFLI